MNELDPRICRRARLSRDHRFDGEFFLAVKTTGIYCRPICPAPAPQERNVHYFRSAAQAAQAGYRPCLRCRPESAPSSPAWLGTETTLRRAVALIQEGYLNTHSLAELAARLGVGERYLRKLFQQKLGVSPSTVAQTQRLHFAQKLLLETSLPITQVAFASGFGSVRRFNSATRAAFGCAAGELRRRPRAQGAELTLSLTYRPPYDWDQVMAYFSRHAVPGIESLEDGVYRRHLRTAHGVANVRVRHGNRDRHALELSLSVSDNRDMMQVVSTLRRMFDLDAQPTDIEACLAADPVLAALAEEFPGVRSLVCASPFESCVRGILGQQVSTQAARSMCARVAEAAAERVDGLLVFPGPEALATVPDEVLRMPASRRNTLRAVCEFFTGIDQHDADSVLAGLADIKGIGPWTLNLLQMRGYGRPDCFPEADLGIIRAAESRGITSRPELRRRSEAWQPWRSYAANLFWRSLNRA